jgi:protein gp37
MATNSTIEWTEMTWNPVTGCTKVSEGCRHCYAERMAKRLQAMGNRRYVSGFRVTLHEDLIDLPKKMRQPRLIFVNSMSDLFHEAVPEHFIAHVFDTMGACPQHTFKS